MIALLGAELNRLRSRRITLVTLLVVVLAAGLFQFAVNSAVTPPSATELAQGRAQYEEALRDYEQNRDQYAQGQQECLDMGVSPEECDPAPKLEWFVTQATPFAEIAPVALTFATLIAGLGAFFVAASFIGAEYTSGSISNWLTFIPQRARVFAAKALAVVLGAGLGGTVILGGTLAAAAGLTSAHGGELTKGAVVTASAARGVGLVVAFALISFGLTLLARHTAAAIGVLVAYGLLNIVLQILFNFLPGLQRVKRFLPDMNFQAFLNKGHTYQNYYPGVGSAEDTGRVVERTLSVTHGGLYWLVLTAVTLVVALLVFRRRDVV